MIGPEDPRQNVTGIDASLQNVFSRVEDGVAADAAKRILSVEEVSRIVVSESVRFANVISALSDVMGLTEATGDLENRLDVADDTEEALAWYEMVAYFDRRIARHQHAAELMQSILTEDLALNRPAGVCWDPTIRLE
ncbi:hypothetical protein KUV65_08780 [Maritalea mobilis]|uniref:hypothetical protein n=1 Tax=Maritalea mobilis TaxID=483324 RepID=UPI001C97BD77|nr:hypothetical protein [Maritalea mobilis]MBY6201454.1 hypothetical protein [Maritalea mobilis]